MLSQSSDFYVTLPSNGSKGSFPNNKPNSFKNQLSRELILNGEWEVGLTEVHYPVSWRTIDKPTRFHLVIYRYDRLGAYKSRLQLGDFPGYDSFLIPLEYGIENMSIKAPIHSVHGVSQSADILTILIPVGNYHSPEILLDTINTLLTDEIEKIQSHTKESFNGLVDISYSKISNRIYFRKRYNYLDMVYYKDDDIARLLGLGPLFGSMKYKREAVTYGMATKPPILDSFSAIYIYTDIISDEHVGNAMVPLLRSISVKGESGEVVHETFKKVYYKLVNRNNIQSIEIQLNTPTGADIRFETGTVICVLHFKKIV